MYFNSKPKFSIDLTSPAEPFAINKKFFSSLLVLLFEAFCNIIHYRNRSSFYLIFKTKIFTIFKPYINLNC